MTEKEVLDLQAERGNQEFFLILVGSFLHAYGHGAFALSRATGYRVMRKQRRQLGEVLTTGFPVAQLDAVREKVFAADFRDRVVHHLIARRVSPDWYRHCYFVERGPSYKLVAPRRLTLTRRSARRQKRSYTY